MVRGRMGPGQVRAGWGVPSPSNPSFVTGTVTSTHHQLLLPTSPSLCCARTGAAQRSAQLSNPPNPPLARPHTVPWGGCPHYGHAQSLLPFHSAQQPGGPCPAEGAVVAAMVRPRRRYCPAGGAGGTRCHRGERR